MTTLDHTRVLVTGSGGGIGAAIAREVASRGAHVAVTDIDLAAAEATARTITSAGGHARAYRLDVTDQAQAEDVATAVEDEFGPLNAWVNNAGVSATDVPDDAGRAREPPPCPVRGGPPWSTSPTTRKRR